MDDARLTEIERKHSLDAKNSALLRSMAVKRFTKYKKSSAHSQEPRTKVKCSKMFEMTKFRQL